MRVPRATQAVTSPPSTSRASKDSETLAKIGAKSVRIRSRFARAFPLLIRTPTPSFFCPTQTTTRAPRLLALILAAPPLPPVKSFDSGGIRRPRASLCPPLFLILPCASFWQGAVPYFIPDRRVRPQPKQAAAVLHSSERSSTTRSTRAILVCTIDLVLTSCTPWYEPHLPSLTVSFSDESPAMEPPPLELLRPAVSLASGQRPQNHSICNQRARLDPSAKRYRRIRSGHVNASSALRQQQRQRSQPSQRLVSASVEEFFSVLFLLGDFTETSLELRSITNFYWLGQILQTLYFWKAYDT